MAQVLSQDEVDALLTGITDGGVEVEADEPADAPPANTFDLAANQDRIIRGRMPTLEMLHDRFCRLFRTAITSMLRRAVDVSVLSTEMLKYGDFMRTVPVPTSMHIFRIDPFKGNSLLVVEGKLVFALIDNFFGGRGNSRFKLEGRDFTPIEQRIIRNVVGVVLESYQTAWEPVHDVQVEWTRAETNPQFAAVCPASDVVCAVQTELDLEDSQGKLTFIIPYSSIEPIKDRLRAGFQSESNLIDQHWQRRLREELHEVRVDCRVDLGHAEITGRELLEMQVGDTIQLNETTTTPAEVFIEDVPKFFGYVGSFHGNRAIQIDHAAPQKGVMKSGE